MALLAGALSLRTNMIYLHAAGAQSFVDRGLRPGTPYYYRVLPEQSIPASATTPMEVSR